MAQLRDLLVTGTARFVNGAYFGGASTFGSVTQPIWWNNGFPQATTYSLSATLNAGSANRLAYYSGTNVVSPSAHYASATQLGVNITNASTIGSRSLYVNGTSYYYDTMEARTNASHLGLKLGNTYLNAINGDVIFQNNSAIRFGGDSWDYNVWAGLKYVHSNKKIVLGLADGTEFSANAAQSGGTFKIVGMSTVDMNKTASITNLAIGGGIYWNPYVESATDGSDAASITVLKSGAAGGTELRIQQQNDANDIINLVASKWIYLNGKRAFTINDAWLRINEDNLFTEGIYTGQSIVRTDAQFQVGDGGSKFYANSSGNGYFSNTLGIAGTNTGYKLYVNGNTRVTDYIYREYTASNQTPMIWMNGMDYDNYLFQISGGTATKQYYGYSLKYIGTGSGTANYLRLYADNQNNTDIIATSWNESGQIGFGADPDKNFKIYVNGNSRFNGDIMLHRNVDGDSPALVFNRGTTINGTDSYDDWRIYVTAGAMHIQERPGASNGVANAWVDNLVIDNKQITLPDTKTPSRLMWTDGNRIVQAANHYASADRVAINYTSNPSYNFYVNGTSYFNGQVTATQFNGALNGNATSATKLQTARNIILNGNLQGFASFNGTGDATITALNYQSHVGGGNTHNYPWHRIATTVVGTSQYTDKSALLRIRHTFNGGGEGLVKVSVRTNSTGSGCDISAIWLYRYNIAANNIGIGLWGVTGDNVYLDVYYKYAGGWPRAIVESISNGRVFTLISSNEVDNTTTTDKKTSSEVYTSIENGATLIRGKAYTKIVYGLDGVDNGRYVLKTGDTMTGILRVNNAPIFGYRYGQSNNAPAFIFDKNGSYYTGIGANGSTDTIYFGAVTTDGNWNWITSYKQKWVFNGNITADKVYGAVWNDYAEYRSTSTVNPGQCVVETGLGDLVQSTKRLQPGANIVSDTFGFAIGETEQTKTPLAVSGRVLAYPYEDRNSYQAGDPVCSGPNGTISKMTREEVREYPDRIVGTVSEIPEYETWGTGKVKVNGRIWIKVK